MKRKISLYECMNTAYPTDGKGYITCRKGHQLSHGHILAFSVKRGAPLECSVCQTCQDISYAPMQYPNEKGWIK